MMFSLFLVCFAFGSGGSEPHDVPSHSRIPELQFAEDSVSSIRTLMTRLQTLDPECLTSAMMIVEARQPKPPA